MSRMMNEEDEDLIETEQSVFHTRIPRPLSSTKHLAVVAVCCALALIAAIYFAERASHLSLKPKNTQQP